MLSIFVTATLRHLRHIPVYFAQDRERSTAFIISFIFCSQEAKTLCFFIQYSKIIEKMSLNSHLYISIQVIKEDSNVGIRFTDKTKNSMSYSRFDLCSIL